MPNWTTIPHWKRDKKMGDKPKKQAKQRTTTTISMHSRNGKSGKMRSTTHSNVWETTTNCPFTTDGNDTTMPTTKR